MNDLASYRIKNAKSRLDASKMLLGEGFYKDSVNRSYYAIFDSMRTVLAEEGVDYRKRQKNNTIMPWIFIWPFVNFLNNALLIPESR